MTKGKVSKNAPKTQANDGPNVQYIIDEKIGPKALARAPIDLFMPVILPFSSSLPFKWNKNKKGSLFISYLLNLPQLDINVVKH